MKKSVLAFVAVAMLSSPAMAQSSDQRCSKATGSREAGDRCNCSAQAGGIVKNMDAKGQNVWDIPPQRFPNFLACMRGKGYKM